MSPVSLLIGAVVGLIVGLTATGGGSLLTPALVLLLGVPPSAAVGTDVAIATVMKLFGGAAYAARKAVHWPTVLRLAAGSIPCALFGIAVLNHVPREALETFMGRALGLAMI